MFNRFKSKYDYEDYVPQFINEWLTEGEIREKKETKDSVNQNNYGKNWIEVRGMSNRGRIYPYISNNKDISQQKSPHTQNLHFLLKNQSCGAIKRVKRDPERFTFDRKNG